MIELNAQNAAALIDGHPFAVIDFHASSDPTSAAFAPIFAAAAAGNPAGLFARVDTEQQQAVCAQFGIAAAPVLMVIRNNVIVHAQERGVDAAALHEALAAAQELDMQQAQQQVNSADAITLGAAGPTTAARPVPAAVDAGAMSIEAYLRPAFRGPASALTDVLPRLAAGEIIAIHDAFEPAFAERMHRSLDGCTAWQLYARYDQHFHYHHHSLYDAEEFPADLAWCAALFDAPATKAWVTRLSGRACHGPAEVGASWYLPGDHSLPHNDVADSGAAARRQVAFVWHLAKDWQSAWGGALYWCPKAAYLAPAFNTLYIFNVGPESSHFVTTVSPFAQGKRLAINGWWTGPGDMAEPAWAGPARVAAGTSDVLAY